MEKIDLDKMVQLHVNQKFDRPHTPAPEHFIGTCNLFPNELAYLVECRTGRVEVINNVAKKVFGIRGINLKQIEDLYEVVSSNHLGLFFKNSLNMIELVTGGDLDIDPATPNKDTSYTVYQSTTGKMIMRKGFILSVDSNGAMEYTGGFLTDVTNLFPKRNFNFHIQGPNQDIFHARQRELSEYNSILSHREIEVLHLVGQGYKSKHIASLLHISPHTVYKHRLNILNKLEKENTVEAYNKALDMGLLKLYH